MKRYSLSIFKNPEMHDRGNFITYKDFIEYKNNAADTLQLAISVKRHWKDEYDRVLKLAEAAQTKARDMESRLTGYKIICALYSLAFILSFLLSKG